MAFELGRVAADNAPRLTGEEVFVDAAINANLAPTSFDVIMNLDVLARMYNPGIRKLLEWAGVAAILAPPFVAFTRRVDGFFAF